jgi:hypothetical protein
MRSFVISVHVRSQYRPRLYPSNALRAFRVCVTRVSSTFGSAPSATHSVMSVARMS